MSDPIPFKPVSNTERKERAEDAKRLLENKAFTAAILMLRKQWFAELMGASTKLAQDEIVAKLKALEAIPQQLTIFINDQKMQDARNQ